MISMVYLFTISLSTNYSIDNVESFFVFPFYNYDLFRPYLPPTPQFQNGTPNISTLLSNLHE